MQKMPKTLVEKLNERLENENLRQLPINHQLIDFSSNDYLGLAKNEDLFEEVHNFLIQNHYNHNGSSGSRLISGNHPLYEKLESFLSDFHQVEEAIVFSSGFAANIGFFSSVPQKKDLVLFDEYCHASIREGLLLSSAKSYKFKHNDLADLERLLKNNQNSENIYVVTESVFSMDGDSPDFHQIINLKKTYPFYLIVDEAHAVGVFGAHGEGLLQSLGYHEDVFARIITFSKAIGCHGGAILVDKTLKHYLINFARSFIYSTALTPHTLATILLAYEKMAKDSSLLKQLHHNITYFGEELKKTNANLSNNLSAIQTVSYFDAIKTKKKSLLLSKNGFHAMPILSPTVPRGKERIRLCLHNFNTEHDIFHLIKLLNT